MALMAWAMSGRLPNYRFPTTSPSMMQAVSFLLANLFLVKSSSRLLLMPLTKCLIMSDISFFLVYQRPSSTHPVRAVKCASSRSFSQMDSCRRIRPQALPMGSSGMRSITPVTLPLDSWATVSRMSVNCFLKDWAFSLILSSSEQTSWWFWKKATSEKRLTVLSLLMTPPICSLNSISPSLFILRRVWAASPCLASTALSSASKSWKCRFLLYLLLQKWQKTSSGMMLKQPMSWLQRALTMGMMWERESSEKLPSSSMSRMSRNFWLKTSALWGRGRAFFTREKSFSNFQKASLISPFSLFDANPSFRQDSPSFLNRSKCGLMKSLLF